MGFFLQFAAGGFIPGIIFARMVPLGTGWILVFFLAGLACIGLGTLLQFNRTTFATLVAVCFACFGAAVTIYHLDTSSESHLATLLRQDLLDTDAVIHGVISDAPDRRERYTIVSVKVTSVISGDGRTRPVSRGKLYVKVYPTYGNDYFKLRYGSAVELSGLRVHIPREAANPGAFDMKRFLNNQHFYAIAGVRNPEQLKILSYKRGNFLMRLSLNIKNHLLISIKNTLPFPESSFLGGVLLGLRSGLSYDVKNDFRAAGVSHVLAVSGLHVTIITLFFMGMFALFRLPRSTSFILIALALIIFTLITGARISTIRALIMNLVTLMFHYFRGIKLDRSFLLGISAAALIILFLNPLVLTEAAFLFSFTAVLSLSLLTRPIWDLAARFLRGYFRIFLSVAFLLAIAVILIDPRMFLEKWPITVTVFILLGGAAIADKTLAHTIEFRRLPKWFTVFAAAQLAIQLGMLPLSALYFKKLSVTAVLTNFIAIPLIGVIVQLGLLAGILFHIPIIGHWIGLTLNATNWLCIKLFLATAHYFGTRFPYPDVSPPGEKFLFVYYLGLLALATLPWLQWRGIPRMRLVLQHASTPRVKQRLIVLACIFAAFTANGIGYWVTAPKELKIYFFDPTIFHLGGGNSVFIQTPGGYSCLIDGGPRRGMIRGREIPLDVGGKVILPALLELGCHHLNVLLSSPRSDYAGGLVSILKSRAMHINTFYHPLPVTAIATDEPDRTIITRLNDPSLLDPRKADKAVLLAWDLKDIFTTLAKRKIKIARVKEGLILHRESVSAKKQTRELIIRVLNPPEELFTGRYSTSKNSAVIQVEFGKLKVLLTSNSDKTAQKRLQDTDIRSTVLQVPANGAGYGFDEDFIQAVSPRIAVLSPNLTRWQKKRADRTLQSYRNLGAETYSTETDGAVVLRSDGETLSITTYLSHRNLETEL